MARKAKAAPKAAPKAKDEGTAGPRRRDVLVLIPEKTLRALLKNDDVLKGKMDGLNGELRESIGNAVNKHQLHKGAYALVKKLHRMKSAEARAEFWHTAIHYMDMLGLTESIDAVEELPFEDGEGEETDAGDKAAPEFGGAQRERHAD